MFGFCDLFGQVAGTTVGQQGPVTLAQVTVTVTITVYLFWQHPVKENEPPVSLSIPAWTRDPTFYAFYAWWIYFPQSGALAEGTSRPRALAL
jgi:hypothetical protein